MATQTKHIRYYAAKEGKSLGIHATGFLRVYHKGRVIRLSTRPSPTTKVFREYASWNTHQGERNAKDNTLVSSLFIPPMLAL